jgi:Holliday junction DNA helicase RuvA
VIASLDGVVKERGLDHVVVDVGGVGLRLSVSLNTLGQLPQVGGRAQLLTHLQVREDALTLYGFVSAEERTAFELCLSVQQVGPKLAMSILSTLDPGELAQAVRSGDHARLRRIPGVGQKTAERLALELRDKLDKAGLSAARASSTARPPGKLAGHVSSALVNLGYRAGEAERAAAEAEQADPAGTVEQLLKRALRALAE